MWARHEGHGVWLMDRWSAGSHLRAPVFSFLQFPQDLVVDKREFCVQHVGSLFLPLLQEVDGSTASTRLPLKPWTKTHAQFVPLQLAFLSQLLGTTIPHQEKCALTNFFFF